MGLTGSDPTVLRFPDRPPPRDRRAAAPYRQATALNPPLSLPARIVGTAAALLLRMAHATWRKDDADLARLDELLAGGSRVIAAFWHGRFIPLFSLMRGRRCCVFASRSFHGEVVAEICRWFGYDYALIADSGGRRTWETMVAALSQHRLAAVAVDGPYGPYHAVKRGALDVAATCGFVILPVSVAMRRHWSSRKRWDKREVPQPFTAVALAVGEPVRLAGRPDSAERFALRSRIRDAIEATDRRAEAKLAGGQPASSSISV